MESVRLDGVTYVRTADAAKEFDYTADYIGQLCRDRKVDARLIGRVWYVDIDSIKAYRKQKHTTRQERASEKKRKKAIQRKKKNTVKVAAPVHKVLINQGVTAPTSAEQKKLTVQYEQDDHELFPTVRVAESKVPSRENVELQREEVQSEPHRIKVKLLDDGIANKSSGHTKWQAVESLPPKPAKIKVELSKQVKPSTTLVADELPSVALQGTLSVAEPDDNDFERPDLDEDEVVDSNEKNVKKQSKLKIFLIKSLLFITWPVRILWKLVMLVLRPFVKIGRKLFTLISKPLVLLFGKIQGVRKTKKSAHKTPSFVPTSTTSAAGSSTTHHDLARVISLVISALLIGVLLLSIGSEFGVEDNTVETQFYVDQDALSELIFAR